MKKFVLLVLFVAASMAIFRLLSTNPSATPQGVSDSEAHLILFWGQGCPHCETVKKFIQENDYDNKTKISYKEVYLNKENQLRLQETADKCPDIDQSQGIGVPFAYVPSTNKCFIGDQPIIDYLNSLQQ